MTIESGTNRLVRSTTDDIVGAVAAMDGGSGTTHTIPELWDGHASDRIADILSSA